VIRHVETTGYGRPATEALLRAIAGAKEAGPLAPVTVVVGSNLAGLSLRRLLGSGALGGSGVANVAFITPFQVAELLAPEGMHGKRPLTNPVLGAVVRRALAADPGPFHEVVDHPATESALAGLYAELSQVSLETLDAIAAAGGVSAHAVSLHRRILTHLDGFAGEPELAGAVADSPHLDADSARLGHLVWFLPAPPTPSLERMLAALMAVRDTTVVVGLTGDADADATVLDLCERTGVVVPGRSVDPAPPVAARIVSVPDPDEEVRAAVRCILELAESGVRLDRIGIFYPTPDPYVRTLHQHLAEAGVPANGPRRDRLADSVAGRTLLGALVLPDQQWRRDRVMAVVSAAPLRDGVAPARPAAWENVSRAAGVVGGLDDWARKLAARRAMLVERIDNATGLDVDGVARLQAACDDIDALAGFVQTLGALVRRVAVATTWHDKCGAAGALLTTVLGPANRRGRWPEAEVDAAVRVDDALSRLAQLDELDPRPSQAVFLRALTNELDVGRGRSGRFGEGVLYGPLASAPGQDLDAVILVGMAEGMCPSPRRDDSLLPDSSRSLARPGELALRARRLDDQHRAFLAALATAPPERRVLIQPRGSLRRSTDMLPSRWLLDSASALAGRRVYSTDFADLGPPVVEVVRSQADAVRSAAVPLSLAERDVAELLAMVEAGTDVLDHPATAGSVGRGIAGLRARRSAAFTEWDGNLAGVPIPSPTRDGALLSATGLEQWAACGFRYFLDHVLGLRERDDPERIRELGARDRGSGVHAVLERFFAEVIARGAPEPDESWTPAHRRRMRELADAELDDLEAMGRTGRPVTWRLERARLVALLDAFLTADEQRRAAWRSRPVRVELPFGLDEAEPVIIPLPDGRSVRFRGKADRVDRATDGRWIVLDYKTGAGRKYRELADDEFLAGTTLQLGLYAEAARQRLGGDAAAAYYWMVDEAARFEAHGYAWTPERRARFVDLLATMVDGIDRGVFPAVPGEYDNFRNAYSGCRYCAFDEVCPSDRGVYAEAKVASPELAVRSALQPPLSDEDPVS
jgi:ATP-dependent helicase/nuclease subunit B